MEKTIFYILVFIVFGIVFLGISLRVTPDDRRAVVFRAGKFIGVRGPGFFFLIPFLERAMTIKLSPIEKKYENHRLTTKEKDRVILSWSCTYRVIDVEKAVLAANDFETEMEQEVPLVVQDMGTDEIEMGIGRVEAKLNDRFVEIASQYGIHIENVQVLDVSRV